MPSRFFIVRLRPTPTSPASTPVTWPPRAPSVLPQHPLHCPRPSASLAPALSLCTSPPFVDTTPACPRLNFYPFSWPQPLSLSSLCALLYKGNAHPASGPDQWEKWFIKALSDSVLSLVLELLNYKITHSHFPDSVKPSTISTIFKRGSPFDLANYQGVCCSNFLLSTPFFWLNFCLSPYIAKLGILPLGQIATQPGV
ncbi:hypothetical protein BJV77DRAFT_1074888 [Russula vinacea]|nr:hypothetical protein BJV77DRAFT_1074888 [Russula vinacea]